MGFITGGLESVGSPAGIVDGIDGLDGVVGIIGNRRASLGERKAIVVIELRWIL